MSSVKGKKKLVVPSIKIEFVIFHMQLIVERFH